MTTYRVHESQTFDRPPEAMYDALVAAPLEVLLGTRSGPIPPVRECTGQEGAWGSVGQTRTIRLGDGGTMLETLVRADRAGGDYGYELTRITGPMRPLVRSVDGSFTFEPSGSGTRVTWAWTLHLTSPVVLAVMPAFGFFWRQAAHKAFAALGQIVDADPAPS